MSHFKSAQIIEIEHYKDVFCRKRQSIRLQNELPMLILAEKKGHLIYSGAPVCQDFDEPYFYYTSCVMNCFYDCEYCYLKGMYPSGNLVIFVNIEDTFREVERILTAHSVYLCVSYDTDLMALEDFTGFVRAWMQFAGEHTNLKIEIRTKCGRTDLFREMEPRSNVIFAFTLSPEKVIEQYEHRTATLKDRICCIRTAMERGYPVRLCFDPMIYFPDWHTSYAALVKEVVSSVDMENIYDVSVGSFRISQDYLKKMRKVLPHSPVTQFPYENENGVYHYPSDKMEKMENFLIEELKGHIPVNKIFRWQSGSEEEYAPE